MAPVAARHPRAGLRSVLTFINGVTASTVASRSDWPAARQIEQLRLQLELLHAWATASARLAMPEKPRKSSDRKASA